MPVQEQERAATVAPADPWRPPTSTPLRLAPAPRSTAAASSDPVAPIPARPRRVPDLASRDDDPRPTTDLEVRLHAPLPQVVIVRVAGAVDQRGAALLAERVGQQLDRAEHVVLDLGEVSALGPVGVDALTDLHVTARRHRATLYLTGADHDAVRGPLQLAGADRLFVRTPSADAVTALHRLDVDAPTATDGIDRPTCPRCTAMLW